ncbi:LuxR family transcriptional regulator [Arthrobacter sp. SAFR-044]|uniref:LuxR family transcriptional regulator n=1 Tax=Arthrobacter sp. SAFR-044 TaxID=3387278 RepID=UPI003F7C0A69
MRTFVRTTLLALLLLAAPALAAGTATAAAPVSATGQALPERVASGSSGGAWAAATSPTPSPGDTASTGPANPGTGESAQNESTRLNYTPWVVAGVAVLVVIAILIFRRRRNTTIVG